MLHAEQAATRLRNPQPSFDRFPAELRPRLADCAALSPRLAQLAGSHPFAFVALATRSGTVIQRNAAVRATLEGAPLAEISAELSIPLCFRRLPPEACHGGGPLPPWSRTANRLLSSHVPEDPAVAARWVTLVNLGHVTGGETFALWVARQDELMKARHIADTWLLPLALHAWYSEHPDLDAAPQEALRWTPRCGLATAMTNARLWLRWINLLALLGREGLRDPWFPGGSVGAYLITPLLRPDQIFEEARRMSNCIASYGEELSGNACRLYAMTREGQSVATFEIRAIGPNREARITQLKGPMNRECDTEIWTAAAAWLEAQSGEVFPRAAWRARASRRSRLHALLKPYAAAHPAARIDPDDLSMVVRLSMSIVSLLRETGVARAALGWPRLQVP